jgi:tRNA threonylcarbamoyladenosine biosynthesis protein TsaE
MIAIDSEEEMRRLGAQLGAELEPGDLVGLRGDLGAGKTVFVRGLAEGLGIAASKVRSPTFTLINEYSGGRLPLYHLDLYRMEPTEVDRLALRDYLYGDAVCGVEWIERLGEAAHCLDIEITIVGAGERSLVASANTPRYRTLLTALEAKED